MWLDKYIEQFIACNAFIDLSCVQTTGFFVFFDFLFFEKNLNNGFCFRSDPVSARFSFKLA